MSNPDRVPTRTLLLAAAASLLALGSTGCIVAGYSSNGGAFIFPGFGVLFVILLIVFVLMRRR